MKRREEILSKIEELEAANAAAPGWGAAVGARHEWIKSLRRELDREQLSTCQRPEDER